MNYYFDTNIFLYAADPSSEFHTPSRRLLELAAEGKVARVVKKKKGPGSQSPALPMKDAFLAIRQTGHLERTTPMPMP